MLSEILARGRALALMRMTSRVTIRRKNAVTTVNKFTVPSWDVKGTDVPFRLGGAHAGPASSKPTDVGGAKVQEAARTGNLAHDWTDLADGDLIEITAGENAGLVLEVLEATWQDQATARRFPVITVPRPKEWT